MVKHPAWAAAINSSGLVPLSFSKRVLKEYGVSVSTPESVERLPLPARPVPRQIAFALRIMESLHCARANRIRDEGRYSWSSKELPLRMRLFSAADPPSEQDSRPRSLSTP